MVAGIGFDMPAGSLCHVDSPCALGGVATGDLEHRGGWCIHGAVTARVLIDRI